jgi:type VI secretion system protein ImpA
MATSPLLDFEALIARIPGDDPAGSPLSYDTRSKLEEDRRQVDADPDDSTVEPKMADWPAIIRLGQETLSESSKDLLVAARLAEALVKEHGFAGLRDGLRLLRELVEQCWERLHPPVEDGDLEARAGPLHWLDEPDRGARFPSTLRAVPIVFGAEGQYSWRDWRLLQEGRGSVTREDFEKAILATPVESFQSTVEDLAQSAQELNRLDQALHAKMGPAAPGLTGLRQALEDCRALVQQIGQLKCPPPASGADIHTGDGNADQLIGSAGRLRSRSRAEVYRQLEQAATLLQELEPHSPIPYLIQRAVELGALSFPQLIKALIREPTVLAELNRELGIQEKPEG